MHNTTGRLVMIVHQLHHGLFLQLSLWASDNNTEKKVYEGQKSPYVCPKSFLRCRIWKINLRSLARLSGCGSKYCHCLVVTEHRISTTNLHWQAQGPGMGWNVSKFVTLMTFDNWHHLHFEAICIKIRPDLLLAASV